jgi:probable O-glycosylation ligase (exosortase A-associated)
MQMPDRWFDRIESIGNYQEYTSMKGRYNAWSMAWNLARDRPVVGGGFAIDSPDIFARYAPVPGDVHSAHSIYFQMLGQHGFVGLGIFLALGVLMWRIGNRVIAAGKKDSSLRWSADLAKAIQVSMIGFAVGGITVNIGYWDVIYFELVVMVALEQFVMSKRGASITTASKKVATTTGTRAIGEITGGVPSSPPRPGGARSKSI